MSWVDPERHERPEGRGRRPASFLLRATVWYAVVALVWFPLQAPFVRLLARWAERALRLFEHPTLISRLDPAGNLVVIHSVLSGSDPTAATWDAWNLHVYVVASLALVLAVPERAPITQLKKIVVVLLTVFLICLAICVVQVKTIAARHAESALGVTIVSNQEAAILDAANRGLIMIGMLAFPAFLFFITYLRAGQTSRPGPAPRWAAAAVTTMLVVVAWGALPSREPLADPQARHAAWQRVLALNPDSAPALVNVALYRQEHGELDSAMRLYEKAVRADPGLVAAHFNLGNAQRERGLYDEAAQSYAEALRLAPDDATAHRNLAVVLLHLDRPCAALTHLRQSLGISSDANSEAAVRATITKLASICERADP